MNITTFMSDYENLKNNFEDMKVIVSSIPIDKLSLNSINSLNKSLERLKKDSKIFLKSLDDNPYLYDMFEGGSESRCFCNKIGVEESKFYEMKNTLYEISIFDLKKFILEKEEL